MCGYEAKLKEIVLLKSAFHVTFYFFFVHFSLKIQSIIQSLNHDEVLS